MHATAPKTHIPAPNHASVPAPITNIVKVPRHIIKDSLSTPVVTVFAYPVIVATFVYVDTTYSIELLTFRHISPLISY